jgi:hypothetical protein
MLLGKGISMSYIGVNRNQELVEKRMGVLIEKNSVLDRIYSRIPGRCSVCNPSRVVVLTEIRQRQDMSGLKCSPLTPCYSDCGICNTKCGAGPQWSLSKTHHMDTM